MSSGSSAPTPLRTALIGAGRVGVGYASDQKMARHFAFATHAQVLSAHDAFEWVAVLDPSAEAQARIAAVDGAPVVTGSLEELVALDPEIVVLAVPPGARIEVIEALPSLRGVLVEKPLGGSLEEAEAFLSTCRRRGILVQVNLLRRSDELFRALAGGDLAQRIGQPQAITGAYGNGFRNNGTHVVDFIRMLVGEFESVWAHGPAPAAPASSVGGDRDLFFGGRLLGGATVSLHPLSFEHYREVSLDIWGTKGRLAFVQEGLVVLEHRRRPNRALDDAWEIASDAPVSVPTTVSSAFFHMYTNLAEAVAGSAELWSPGESGLRSASVVEAAFRSLEDGRPVACDV